MNCGKHAIGRDAAVDRERRELAGGVAGVEDVEQHADRPGTAQNCTKHEDAADQQRLSGAIARLSAAQVPLHHELIGAVRRGRQERAADDAGPERVAARRLEGEVEHAQLWPAPSRARRPRPSRPGSLCQQDERRRQRADQVDARAG